MNFTIEPPKLQKRWRGELVIVAASGPSLTKDIAEQCKGHRIIAVNDAYKLMPFADVLYACDAKWWYHHEGCPSFDGEKWSSHSEHNDKRDVFLRYKVRVARGEQVPMFSADSALIHYGGKGGANGGFQAVNIAILWGAAFILLVGFDMRTVNGKSHFFGDHPAGFVKQSPYKDFIAAFDKAAKQIPKGVQIINCTEGSALKCFPSMSLYDALKLGHQDRMVA